MRWPHYARFIGLGLVVLLISVAVAHSPQAHAGPSPIQHVVIIYQENHSFDNVLGKMCSEIDSGQIIGHMPCDGATTGQISNGSTIPLSTATDKVPNISHDVHSQTAAIDGGKMDGFDKIGYCGANSGYKCYSQFDPSQIPNLSSLAENFVVSDRTFEYATTPSWAGHMVLASATLDGFFGDNPSKTANMMGWGCDSGFTTKWWNGSAYQIVPSCIPNAQGQGPFEPSPVPYVPTIFDRLDSAGLSWKIYGGVGGPGSGYGWTICPTFYECLGSSQHQNLVAAKNVVTAAKQGTLPSFSIVTPTSGNSQHNVTSMAVGDNWIGNVVSSIENGPDWPSTAIFIAYDDCGCFYDHVSPPSSSMGIRVPMVIVSPYAKPGYTDSNDANLVSMLAYLENNFGLMPLNSADGSAYNYSDAFDYSQLPLKPVKMVNTKIPAAEQQWLNSNPPDANDPT